METQKLLDEIDVLLGETDNKRQDNDGIPIIYLLPSKIGRGYP